jgi:hypothetical protein
MAYKKVADGYIVIYNGIITQGGFYENTTYDR